LDSLELLATVFELLTASLELLAISLEELMSSLELLTLVAEEVSGEVNSAELFVSPRASFEEDDSVAGASADDSGSVIGGSAADDKFVSLEGVVCSLISAFSALEEESEEQAAAKKATPAQREKRLKRGDFMP
jgi:hypothetical protein